MGPIRRTMRCWRIARITGLPYACIRAHLVACRPTQFFCVTCRTPGGA